MNTVPKKITVTVGIPTCYGGDSLVDTAKSIYASIGAFPDHFIICADRTPLSAKVRQSLEDMGISIIWNTVEGSQSKKIKQLLEQTTTDLFICTQDDVLFDPHALKHIIDAFQQDAALTMVGARIAPLPTVTMFARAMASMMSITRNIARRWNAGDNYLAASGRCLAFRTEFFKKGRILEEVINGDMFFYLENKALGGTFAYVDDAIVSISCPQHVRDQVRPSSRYQYSQEELQRYFSFDISSQYKIPRTILVRSALQEVLMHPIATLTYIAVFCYTRIRKQSKNVVSNPVWDIDSSTKKVHSKELPLL